MAAGQLWLFPPPKPLVERLGDDFFRALPSGPGVYLMCGATEGVLYVGRARNLRKRMSAKILAKRLSPAQLLCACDEIQNVHETVCLG
ncbi:MAG: hypothetical protein WBS33_11160 [Verrucomicrobiia bacterium]